MKPNWNGLGQDDTDSTPAAAAPATESSGGWYSSLTSWLSSSPAAPADASTDASTDSSGSPDAPAAPAAVAPDPQTQWSKYYKLQDLCVTSLPYPNLPTDEASQNNLKQMGACLDAIRDNVGSFTIASCYRSPENQLALTHGAGGAAAQKMAVTKSYHSQGLAADITPTNGMTPTQFAQAIYNNPITNTLCGQLVDKSEGGNETSLHLSIRTSRFPACTPMYVGSDGQYYRMTATQIQSWQSSKVATLSESSDVSLDQDDEDYDEGDVTAGPNWAVLGGVAGALVASYYGWQYYQMHRGSTRA